MTVDPDGDSLSVVFLPAFNGNSYLDLLADALRAQSCRVTMHQSLSAAHRAGKAADVLHLHWEKVWTVQPTRRRAIRLSGRLFRTLLRMRRRGTALIWTVHNLRDHESSHPHLERVLQIILARLVHRVVVHHPAAVRTASHWLAIGQGRIAVMEHGAYPTHGALTQDTARQMLGLPLDATIFASVGFVRSYKRIPVLVDAVRSLDGDVLLFVAGEPRGDESGRVLASAGGDPVIRLSLRRQTEEEIGAVLTAADAFVIAAAETFTSGSALLAMSYGRAIIAVDSPHIRFLCGDSGARYCSTSTVDCLRDAMSSTTRSELHAMGEYNVARAAEFGWDNAAHALRDVYDQVLAVSRP